MATRIPGGSEEQPGYAFSMKSNGHSTQKSTKISIPHSLPPECTLVGVLEQVQPNETTKGRKLALVSIPAFSGLKALLTRTRLSMVYTGQPAEIFYNGLTVSYLQTQRLPLPKETGPSFAYGLFSLRPSVSLPLLVKSWLEFTLGETPRVQGT